MSDEKQIVRISIDKSRSHITGIMPYIPYNGESSEVKFVSSDTNNGNWGGFPLDIVVNGKRLRYAELIRRYNIIQDILDRSVFGVGVVKYKYINNKVECEQTDCAYDIPEREKEAEITISTHYDAASGKKLDILDEEDVVVGRYDFIPIPLSEFGTKGDGVYYLNYKMQDGESGVGYRTDYSGPVLEEGKYYVLMPDYDVYERLESLWNEWWEECGESFRRYFAVPEGDFTFCRVVEKYLIGKVSVPEDIVGIRVPQYVYFTAIKGLMKWFEDNDLTEEGCLEGKTQELAKRFEENGGLEFYNFLKSTLVEVPWIDEVLSGYAAYEPPYIAVPISLEDNHEYGGMYRVYEFSYSEEDDDFVEAYGDFDCYGDEITRWIEPEDMYAESMLDMVADENATEIDNITGVWGEFANGSQLYRCTYNTGTHAEQQDIVVCEADGGYWTCSRSNARTVKCGDGEYVDRNTNKYRTITTLSCIPNVVPVAANGDWYYFMVKKDNGLMVHFKIPYTEGSFHNMKETETAGKYIGDYITMVRKSDSGDEVAIQYVIGGTATSNDGGQTFVAVPNTGVKYEEVFPYKEGEVLVTFLDGFENVKIIYDSINTEVNKSTVYSDEYRLYRRANIAKIIGMEVGTVLNGNDMIKGMVFTSEDTEYLPDETKNTFSVIIDRGNAAAFEKHFKLSECNTFEDLKNYGNNYYNL